MSWEVDKSYKENYMSLDLKKIQTANGFPPVLARGVNQTSFQPSQRTSGSDLYNYDNDYANGRAGVNSTGVYGGEIGKKLNIYG